VDWLDSIPPDFRGLAIVVFVIASTLLAAWSSRRGAREPDDHEPKVREFAVTGQLADMGPIRELVEQAGLLVQQQVKTNVQLDHLCQSIDRAISEWNTAREQQDREEEIERRVAERMEQERRRPRRSSAE
jgi:hypothetical protein